ncbi:MAG TPA: DUF3108 domain-containing protein [Xanthobacteraceae bacterium]|jgi:hypothetical protein
MTRLIVTIASLASALAAAETAFAGGALEARYSVSFTGVTIGQGALVAEVTDDAYSAAGSAAVAGLLKVVTPGKGTAAARGNFAGGKVTPVSYSVSSESRDRTEEVRLAGASGVIRDLLVLPVRSGPDDRVPITDTHRVGVVDPMSAALMPVSGSGDLTGPDACNRTIPIYDGRQRYDLVLNYERTEMVKDVKGYAGPAARCRVDYRPVAGHRPNRKQVKELSENKEIFVWLAPIAGTRVLAPLKVNFGTKLGVFTVQATHFLSEPRPSAADAPAAR